MKQATRDRMTDDFLLKIINLRSTTSNPYEICKQLELTPTEFKEVIHSPEYKNFVEDWMGYVSDSSKIARKRTLALVNKYERHALNTLFELADDGKPLDRISAAKAALTYCQSVLSSEASREYQEAITRLESLVKEGNSDA